MDACVVVFPGSNCDRDVKVALEAVAGRPVRMVWHADTTVPACDIIVLPGGFAYGDYLRCGAMAAHSPVMRDVVARAKRGTPVLGICNGFQVLTETLECEHPRLGYPKAALFAFCVTLVAYNVLAVLKARDEWKPTFTDEEICHCRFVPLAVVDAAIVAGAHTAEKVSAWTSASTACGTRPQQ